MFPGDVWGVSMGCLWGVSGISGGVWGYLSGFHGNQKRLDLFGEFLGSHSLQYRAKSLFWHIPKIRDFFSPDHTET